MRCFTAQLELAASGEGRKVGSAVSIDAMRLAALRMASSRRTPVVMAAELPPHGLRVVVKLSVAAFDWLGSSKTWRSRLNRARITADHEGSDNNQQTPS